MKILIHLLITALALLAVAYIVPGIEVASFYVALITAVVLGLLNLIVRPILVILTLPITILTLGLFMFVINAAIFWFVASFIDGFAVTTFFAALVGSVLVSIISALGDALIEG